MNTISETDGHELTGIFELLDVVEKVVRSADPALQAELQDTLNAYAQDFPDEFYWAVGVQAPAMLHHLMHALMLPPNTPRRLRN